MAVNNPPPVSPWIWKDGDYLGRTLTITITYNNNTRALRSGTVVREPGCLLRVLLWGLGEDGIPDNTTRKFIIPEGTTTITASQMSSIGLNTAEDLDAGQFTVGF